MKLVWTLIFSLVSSVAIAAGGPSYPLETIEPDYDDKASRPMLTIAWAVIR